MVKGGALRITDDGYAQGKKNLRSNIIVQVSFHVCLMLAIGVQCILLTKLSLNTYRKVAVYTKIRRLIKNDV